MRVWVTRTEPGAAATAKRLRDLEHEPVVAPLLAVRKLRFDIRPGAAALAFTSANAVRAFAAAPEHLALPVFAVGEATAQAARDAGYRDVRPGPADVAALGQLIARSLPPGAGVLHPCATERAGDLASPLQAAGLRLEAAPVYETVVAEPDAAILDALGSSEAVLLHSPKAARALNGLLIGRPASIRRALCLSQAVADALDGGKIADVAFATLPNDTALLNLL